MATIQPYHPILVTGVERSGSSIIAKIINSCDVFSGKTTEMQENVRIKRFMNEFYHHINADPRGQFPLPNFEYLQIPIFWRPKVDTLLQEDGWKVDKRWVYKSARICQTWPIWNYAYPLSKYIIVRRRTGDIIQSCLKTGFMNAFSDKAIQIKVGVDNEADGWRWWIHQHEKRFIEMIEAGLDCKEVWPERMVDGDFQQIYEMLNWLGLEEKQDISTLVKPLLRISEQKERSL